MRIVPRVQTRFTATQVAGMLNKGFASIGVPTSEDMLAKILALIWSETAGTASCWNNNIGNRAVAYIKNGVEHTTWVGDAWRPTWFDPPAAGASDAAKAKHQEMLDGKIPSAFAAYDTAEEGFANFIVMMKKMFPSLLQAAHGTMSEFATAYKTSKYNGAAIINDALQAFTSQMRIVLASNPFAGMNLPKVLAGASGSSVSPPSQHTSSSVSGIPAKRETLRLGSWGLDVEDWQRIAGVKVDGNFGPITLEATKRWQRSHNLLDDGIVGPKTWRAALG